MDLFQVGLVPEKQLVRLAVHDGAVSTFLTLAESEALIKALAKENAKLRVEIARDGDLAEERV